MCGTLNSLSYHWLHYTLDLYPSVLSGYINFLPLAIISLPSLLNLTCCQHYDLSTADSRTKQTAKHIMHTHNVCNLHCSCNPNPAHTHLYHYEHDYDYDPIRSCSTAAMALLAFFSMQLSTLYIHCEQSACSLHSLVAKSRFRH